MKKLIVTALFITGFLVSTLFSIGCDDNTRTCEEQCVIYNACLANCGMSNRAGVADPCAECSGLVEESCVCVSN